jgi:hypothetical protein
MRSLLTSSRLLLVSLGALVVIVAAGVGTWYATSGGGAAHSATTSSTAAGTPTLSHRTYALLYLGAIVKKSRIGILKQWPNPPYQHYTSGVESCYEWWDKPIALYNLCFENGLLTDKAVE